MTFVGNVASYGQVTMQRKLRCGAESACSTRNEREASRAQRTDPIFRVRLAAAYVERWRAPRGPVVRVLRLSLTSCCGAGVSHRPRRAWHSYSLARTDSSEKARRTHASRPFAVLRAACGGGGGRRTSRLHGILSTREPRGRIYRGFPVVISDRPLRCSVAIDTSRFENGIFSLSKEFINDLPLNIFTRQPVH